MAPENEIFTLAVVTVRVTTIDDEVHVEDWNPKDAKEAEEFAQETAQCDDVASTAFENRLTGRKKTFTNATRK